MEYNFPSNIIEQVKFYADSKEGIGILEINGPDFGILILGNQEMPIEQISILIAHALLGGLIHGALSKASYAAEERAAEKEKLN